MADHSFSALPSSPLSSSPFVDSPGCHLAQAPSRAPSVRTLNPASRLPLDAPPSLCLEPFVRKWARTAPNTRLPGFPEISCLRSSPATCLACSPVQPAWISRSAWLLPTAGRE